MTADPFAGLDPFRMESVTAPRRDEARCAGMRVGSAAYLENRGKSRPVLAA